MPIDVIRLGSPRPGRDELRLGTIRHPPRGVPRERLAKDDWYDVWLPALAPAARHVLALLAALSHRTDLAVGCTCADEARCHRSVLRALLQEHGAVVRRGA